MDLRGKRFGRLLVLADTGKRAYGKIWLCGCDCGNSTEVRGGHLVSNRIKSCGCFRRERGCILGKSNITHGGSSTRLYMIWKGLKHRCYNQNATGYKYYGGKDTIVCSEWDDFVSFRDWAYGNGYRDYLTIDRIDSNGNYEPSNCQWITKSENSARQHI